MRTIYQPELKARLLLDDANHVRAINHVQKHWITDKKTPLLGAVDYLYNMASVIGLQESQLVRIKEKVSFVNPVKDQGIEYRLSDERKHFNSSTIGFQQTYMNIPVWHAGITVTVKYKPFRITGSSSTIHEWIEAKLPSMRILQTYKRFFDQAEIENIKSRLKVKEDSKTREKNEAADESKGAETANFLRKLIDVSELRKMSSQSRTDQARLIRGRFYLYKYHADERLPKNSSKDSSVIPLDEEPFLPLPPVPETIQDGRYYVVAEITFTFNTASYGRLNWLALVEITTGTVLYLRALDGSVKGRVYLFDPVTLGNPTATPDMDTADLPTGTLEDLNHLDVPEAGQPQHLRGTYANVMHFEGPDIDTPTEPIGTNFDYSVRTDNFAAVNAYYHVDRFFSLIESLGFDIDDYFANTTFPISVDHRGCYGVCPSGIEVNAHCPGNGLDGIEGVGYMLAHTGDTDNPIGIALDWWVHLHELGAHGILYDQVGSPNFGFSHGPGDTFAAIAIDPYSNAPDRFRMFPWVAINRRCDRSGPAWAWGGANDDNGYSSGEILATTLFRMYRSLGGDSDDSRRLFASRMSLYLLLRTVRGFRGFTNPASPEAFAEAMMDDADPEDWISEGVYGGAYHKVIRWSFEKQGLYAGDPPDIDVYIDDGRHGEYDFLNVFWENNSIWNRRVADGGLTHEEPALGAINYAYVKVKNRGTQTANNVKVRGYHCRPAAGTIWPNDFQSLTTTELSAPGGGTLLGNNSEEKIIGPFEWTPDLNTWGHDCLLMVASADDDESNVDSFVLGEYIPDWRLVPNDNNIGQRNVFPAPGGGGVDGLMKGLHGYSFWASNPNMKTSLIELRVRLPKVLASNGWQLSFKGIPENKFELESGKKREVILNLKPGEEFDKTQIEKTADRDIRISVYADGMLIGGMTYRLDPEIAQPFNIAKKPDCLGQAQNLLDCLKISGNQKVRRVCVKKVTVDIKLDDCHCDE